MLLRNTVTALALAATLGLNAVPVSALSASSAPPGAIPAAPPAGAIDETGGASAALTCLGCVAAGVVTLGTGGIVGIWATFMVGGALAVSYGGAAIACTTACVAYLAQD